MPKLNMVEASGTGAFIVVGPKKKSLLLGPVPAEEKLLTVADLISGPRFDCAPTKAALPTEVVLLSTGPNVKLPSEIVAFESAKTFSVKFSLSGLKSWA